MNDPSQRTKRLAKSRQVSSRFLQSPASPSREIINNNNNNNKNGGNPSSPSPASPVRNAKSRVKPRNPEPSVGGGGLLWPSSAVVGGKTTTKRPKDAVDERQKVGKCDSERLIQIPTKENQRPAAVGGSFKYTGKVGFRGTKPSSPSSSSTSSSSSSSSGSNTLYTNACYVPGRFSIDENALFKSSPQAGEDSPRRQSEYFPDAIDPELCEWAEKCAEFDCFDPSEKIPNRRKLGIEVPSKYLNSITTTTRRASDPKPKPKPESLDRSSSLEVSSKKKKKFNIKGAMRRANSLTGPGTAGPAQWALSPGQTGSPPMTVETGERPMSLSTLKQSTSPKKHKGMDKLLSLGFDLFKSNKTKRISYSPSIATAATATLSATSSFNSTSSSSSVGSSDYAHQLRMIHCRMLQWRYANATAESVNKKMNKQAENDLVSAWNTIVRMQQSVVKKKLQLQKEKLAMKLAFILHSQLKGLESWWEMERQHTTALSTTQESLQAVVCKVPLVKGARVNQEIASLAFRHATDLTNSISSALTALSPPADRTMELLSELAEVVAQEKLLIEEFHEIYQTVSTLQVEESDLKSAIMQLNFLQKQQQEIVVQ